MAKAIELKLAAEYDTASPYRATVTIQRKALAGSSAIGTMAAVLDIVATRYDAAAFGASVVVGDNLTESTVHSTAKAAIAELMVKAGYAEKSYTAVDYKAIAWPEAATDTATGKAKAAKEGDNDVYFFDVEGDNANKLEALAVEAESASVVVREGEQKTLHGNHDLASKFAAMQSMFYSLEGDEKRAAAGFKKWAEKRLAKVPALAIAAATRNGGNRFILMASIPLELCERMNASTPSMIEKRFLDARKFFVQQTVLKLVVLEGDTFEETTDCAAAFLSEVKRYSAEKLDNLEQANATLQKAVDAGQLDNATAAIAAVATARKAMLDCEIVAVLCQDPVRVTGAGNDVKAGAIARSKALSADKQATADKEAADKEAAESAVKAKVAVANGFVGQAVETVAATILAMISVDGVDTGAVLDALIAAYDKAELDKVAASEAAVKAEKEAASTAA